jgi:phosphoribosylaminoimidazolecarboxamide formyltransferase/IMP cyclohydrolase
MIRDLKGTVDYKIPVKTILVSVFDKSGLEEFIPGLLRVEPHLLILSTGGTYTRIKAILGDNFEYNLMEVASYTEFPEMEGGLVKTLHPKIHAGILGERNNPEHQKYLADTLHNARYIDMVVVNLYPFEEVIAGNVSFEKARGNIDIGGPTMIRAAAKNFPSCAAVCDPAKYGRIVEALRENEGNTTFEQRLRLARRVFTLTASYDKAIAEYFNQQVATSLPEVKASYVFRE